MQSQHKNILFYFIIHTKHVLPVVSVPKEAFAGEDVKALCCRVMTAIIMDCTMVSRKKLKKETTFKRSDPSDDICEYINLESL